MAYAQRQGGEEGMGKQPRGFVLCWVKEEEPDGESFGKKRNIYRGYGIGREIVYHEGTDPRFKPG